MPSRGPGRPGSGGSAEYRADYLQPCSMKAWLNLWCNAHDIMAHPRDSWGQGAAAGYE